MSKKYTVTDVADRFEEAAQTLHRLPRVGVKGYFNAMPPVIRTAAEILQEERLPMRMGPPSIWTFRFEAMWHAAVAENQ